MEHFAYSIWLSATQLGFLTFWNIILILMPYFSSNWNLCMEIYWLFFYSYPCEMPQIPSIFYMEAWTSTIQTHERRIVIVWKPDKMYPLIKKVKYSYNRKMLNPWMSDDLYWGLPWTALGFLIWGLSYPAEAFKSRCWGCAWEMRVLLKVQLKFTKELWKVQCL